MSTAIKLDADLMGGFVQHVLLDSFDDPQPTPPFHKVAWDMVTDVHPQVALAAPRGHAKSTGITLAYTMAALLFRTQDFVVLVSATHGKAIEFARNIKDQLLNNEKIQKAFKFKRLVKDAEDDFIAEIGNDGHQFRVIALGFGMSVRGLNWNTRRPGLIVCDDMEDDEQVMNPDRREKAANWFFAALKPALSRTGIMRVVGTILHNDSLLQNLLDDPGWKTHRWEACDEKFGNVLWPEQWSAERLQREFESWSRLGKSDKWQMEYRNIATDTSAGLFREDDMLAMNESDHLLIERMAGEWPYVVGADFAISVKDRRDFTVFVVAVMGPEYLYVIDVVHERLDSEGIVRTMFEIEETYRLRTGGTGLTWYEEDGAIRKALAYSLEQAMRRKNVYLALNPQSPGTTDKRTRSQAIRARIRSRSVKFNKNASWWEDFKNELVQFDKGKHDDRVDAMSWLGIGVAQLTPPNTDEEQDEEDYFHRRREAQPARDGGRSTVTGY